MGTFGIRVIVSVGAHTGGVYLRELKNGQRRGGCRQIGWSHALLFNKSLADLSGSGPISRGDGDLWLPPRADCPDCHQPMEWRGVEDPEGYVYTYTFVERGGTGLEIECPYYQIDVKLDGVGTILKSYLVDRRPIKIGDRVKARFRTGEEATHTCLDLSWELV